MEISYPNLLLCIVIYEKKLDECQTFLSINNLISLSSILLDIVIYDNSKSSDILAPTFNTIYPNFNFHYIHNKNNPGLGVAYNESALIASSLNKKFICFFDQDSEVPNNYFSDALDAINKNPSINLFSPIITSAKVVISPSSFYLGRSWVKKNMEIGLINTSFHSIINSGSIIRLSELIRLGGYEPALELDFSDHYFFYKFKQDNRQFFIMPIYLNHHLSTFFDKEYIKVFNRFKIFYEAAFFFARNTKNKLAFFWAFTHALKLSLVFKRVSFIKYAISIFKK